MFVDRLLPVAFRKLVTIIDSSQLIEATKRLRDAGTRHCRRLHLDSLLRVYVMCVGYH
jgi:hypothetical protein